jgi:putative restriction endonuclease
LEVSQPELLRASHIKPWTSSNNIERFDPANGLLLSAMYDAAFDALLLSFADDGRLMLASDFPIDDAIAAGVNPRPRSGFQMLKLRGI